jgi:Dolichyl-phosphate-mannose-protein mannosyltransferase
MTAPELAESPAAARDFESPGSGRLSLRTPALTVAALTLVGLAIRFPVAGQSIFADELSTYWISATHGLGGVLSLMYGTGSIPHAEITPPLSFLLFWLSTRLGHAPELLRLPSLIAGTVTIPIVFAVGKRSVGLVAAVVASALTTLSPFMIYYSTEARAYGLMMLAVLLSTLGILLALETGRARWWVLYAVSACAAFYLHYTSVFVLAVQFVWVIWSRPSARRPLVIATLAAALGVVPWLPGLINDYQSPTLKILAQLSPFTPSYVRSSLEHWAIGYPLVLQVTVVPGVIALIAFGCSAAVAIVGVSVSWHGSLRARLAALDRRVVLVTALAVATPVGAALESAISSSIFSARNLAASWPYLALICAAALTAPRRWFALVATGLAIVGLAIGTVKVLGSRFERPDYHGAAVYVTRHARPGDVIIDATGTLSPGPLTGLDLVYHGRLPVFRADAPTERGHPYDLFDRDVPLSQAIHQAVAAARGHRVFLITNVFTTPISALAARSGSVLRQFGSTYRLVAKQRFAGIDGTFVGVYSAAPANASGG